MVTSDSIFQRIQAFDRSRGGGVTVRRVNCGYSLYSTATGVPIARLRPTRQADMVEVLWWRRGRWATIGDLGGVILPLDQALDYIANEPLFWGRAISTYARRPKSSLDAVMGLRPELAGGVAVP
jgi:hypothetical protein